MAHTDPPPDDRRNRAFFNRWLTDTWRRANMHLAARRRLQRRCSLFLAGHLEISLRDHRAMRRRRGWLFDIAMIIGLLVSIGLPVALFQTVVVPLSAWLLPHSASATVIHAVAGSIAILPVWTFLAVYGLVLARMNRHEALIEEQHLLSCALALVSGRHDAVVLGGIDLPPPKHSG